MLYAPDYCVNAGGVIQVADELHGFDFARAKAKTELIFGTTARVLATAADEGIPPATAADRLAERRMAGAAGNSPGDVRSVGCRNTRAACTVGRTKRH